MNLEHDGIDAKPLVSVVIPFFNRVDETIRAIASVLAQTYPNVEMVVVNDASTEDCSRVLAYIGGNPKVKYVALENNLGPGGARNAGIAASTGQYLAFLDSDDTWEREKLNLQVKEMRERNWLFSHTSYLRHDCRSGSTTKIRSGLISYRFPMGAFHCLIATPTVVVRRSFLGARTFPADLRFGEDGLLWLALSKDTALHGIDLALANVFVGEKTTALDQSIEIESLELMKRGLEGHAVLLAAHSLYRCARRLLKAFVGRLRK